MATWMKSPLLMLKLVVRLKPSGAVALISTTTPSSCFIVHMDERHPVASGSAELPDGGHDFVSHHFGRQSVEDFA